MKTFGTHNYYTYILTNFTKTVLYTGVTGDLHSRLKQHKENSFLKKGSFTGRYKCIYLVYYEHFTFIVDAIAREKEIKGWSRSKKESLINSFNPEWKFLNDQIEEV